MRSRSSEPQRGASFGVHESSTHATRPATSRGVTVFRHEQGWSRRDVLATAGTAAAAILSPLGAGCRTRPYNAADFARPAASVVGLFSAQYGRDIEDVIHRGLTELQVDVRGRRVLLKPNLVEFLDGRPINTHPTVIVAAALALRRLGASHVVVGEGPGHRRDLEYLLVRTGLGELLREYDLPFVDLNHDDVRWVALRSRFTGLDRLALPATVLDSDFIVSMPKLKTHHWAAMTASMKNLFGVVPGAVYGWPKNILHVHGIDQSILDLVATVKPSLAIVDGIVGMEGDGPIMGSTKPVGAIVMGTDLVAVDATCARVMQLDPSRVRYLDEAGEFLGHVRESRIEQRGETIGRFSTPFQLLDAVRGVPSAG